MENIAQALSTNWPFTLHFFFNKKNFYWGCQFPLVGFDPTHSSGRWMVIPCGYNSLVPYTIFTFPLFGLLIGTKRWKAHYFQGWNLGQPNTLRWQFSWKPVANNSIAWNSVPFKPFFFHAIKDIVYLFFLHQAWKISLRNFPVENHLGFEVK